MIKKIITFLMEQPLPYKIVQSCLVGRGHKVIKYFLRKKIKGGSILDQGCGLGEYSQIFNGNFTGLDNNIKDIEYAKNNFKGEFLVGDAAKMPFKSNSFNFVFAVGLHHHLSESQAKQAIKEGLRVTKRNGYYLIVDAMFPKNKLNIIGFILRKMDRGGYVRTIEQTLNLIQNRKFLKYQILSAFPFDFIAISIKKA